MAHHGAQADTPPHFPTRYSTASKSAQSGCDHIGFQRSPSEDAQGDLLNNYANYRRGIPIDHQQALAWPPGPVEAYMQADEDRRLNRGLHQRAASSDARNWVDIPVDEISRRAFHFLRFQ